MLIKSLSIIYTIVEDTVRIRVGGRCDIVKVSQESWGVSWKMRRLDLSGDGGGVEFGGGGN